MSYSEFAVGDRIMPREVQPETITLTSAPPDLAASILFLPHRRTVLGTADYLYLDRGALQGLQVGNELEVYESGWVAPDHVRRTNVLTPDESVARLLVVSVQPQLSSAVVTYTKRELHVGNTVRAKQPPAVASR